jgi:hypothetical protein
MRFTRSADWTPKLHYAADHIELAADELAKAVEWRDTQKALSNLRDAQAIFGREMLKLDKVRRPDSYK